MMRKRLLYRMLIVAMGVTSLPARVAAQGLDDIVARYEASLKAQRTCRAVWAARTTTKPETPMANDSRMEVVSTADGRYRVASVVTIRSALASGPMKSLEVCDGKTHYYYAEATNQYVRAPMEPSAQSPIVSYSFNPVLGNIGRKGVTFRATGEGEVDGRKCYVLSVVPPAGTSPNVAARLPQTTVYVDIATGRARRFCTVSRTPVMGKIPAAVHTTTFTLLQETLDEPVPEETFVFTPPAGATEVKPPTPVAPKP